MANTAKDANKARRARYLERAASNCCTRCGSKKKRNSKFKYCDSCREYFRQYTKEYKESINALRREQYAERLQNKQCTRCGKKLPAKSSTVLCPVCRKKQESRYN